MRARLAVYLALTVLVHAACGGRLVQNGSDDGPSGIGASPDPGGSASQGATANVGASSHGGRSGTGGATAAGGKATGGRSGVAGSTSAAGAVSVGGASAMGGGCACPAIDCPMGYKTVPNANGCCFHCESLCNNVDCPGVACGSGFHLETLPGQCCPTCLRDSCQEQQKNYQGFRQQLVDKYSPLGCMIDADCTIFYEKTPCAVGCGIAIPSAALNDLDSNLQSYAQTSCSPECAPAIPPCEPRPAPVCLGGRCF